MLRILFFCAVLSLVFPISAFAEAPRLIYYATGTGFFVSPSGYILTNNHVVEKCEKISVNGDNMSTSAQLVARDAEHDLALLKSAFGASSFAYFSSMKIPIKPKDEVVIVGYPKNSWREHNPIVRTSYIIDTKGPTGEDKWLQFNDSVEHGNSGGPLLDSAGNVVGVIVAKAELHLKRQGSNIVESVKKSDIAISLPVVIDFLQSNDVDYRTMDSGIYMSSDSVTLRSRPFIVNIQCRLSGQK